MANILGIITAFLLAIAAFVALKNNDRLKEEVVERDSQLSALKANQERLAKENEDLDALPLEIAGIDRQTAEKKKEEEEVKNQNETFRSDIASNKGLVERNDVKLNEFRKKSEEVGDIDALATKMKDMRVQLADLDQQLVANNANLANLTEETARNEKNAENRKSDLDTLSKGQSLPTLTTKIRAIYPTWGFVTLTDGDNAGVAATSRLNVVRNDKVIAVLLVTAVEPRSASASIVPESLVDDVTLMVGDKVVPMEIKIAAVEAN